MLTHKTTKFLISLSNFHYLKKQRKTKNSYSKAKKIQKPHIYEIKLQYQWFDGKSIFE